MKQYDVLGLLRLAGLGDTADQIVAVLAAHPELVTEYIPSEPSVETVPSGPVGRFGLVLDEQFDTFDTNRWTTHYEWFPTVINNELQQYDPSGVVADGTLKLTATDIPLDGQAYTSGMVASLYGGFDFLYGTIEAKVKIPDGVGLWPAFWLLQADLAYPPEIDIMEHWGNNPTIMSGAVHWGSGGSVTGSSTGTHQGSWYDNWHTFTLLWTPTALVWYVDGQQFHHYKGPNVPTQTMYILANLAVGGNLGGPPDETTVFPAVYELDYIRVWDNLAVEDPPTELVDGFGWFPSPLPSGLTYNGDLMTTVDSTTTAPKVWVAFPETNEVWADWTVTVDSVSGTGYVQGMGVLDGNTKCVLVGFTDDDGTLRWKLTYNPDSGQEQPEAGEVEVGVEYAVQVRFVRSSGADDGQIQMWVDGTLIFDIGGVDNDTRGPNRFQVGNNYRANLDITYRVNNLKVSDSGVSEPTSPTIMLLGA